MEKEKLNKTFMMQEDFNRSGKRDTLQSEMQHTNQTVPGKGTAFPADDEAVFHRLFFSCHRFVDSRGVRSSIVLFFPRWHNGNRDLALPGDEQQRSFRRDKTKNAGRGCGPGVQSTSCSR